MLDQAWLGWEPKDYENEKYHSFYFFRLIIYQFDDGFEKSYLLSRSPQVQPTL